METYATANEVLNHPQRMLISSFKLENGTVITPLFIGNLGCSAPKFTVSFNILLGNALKFLFNQWLTLEEKEKKTIF